MSAFEAVRFMLAGCVITCLTLVLARLILHMVVVEYIERHERRFHK